MNLPSSQPISTSIYLCISVLGWPVYFTRILALVTQFIGSDVGKTVSLRLFTNTRYICVCLYVVYTLLPHLWGILLILLFFLPEWLLVWFLCPPPFMPVFHLHRPFPRRRGHRKMYDISYISSRIVKCKVFTGGS